MSTLTARPNPAGAQDVALTLDGDELVFVSAELDGAPIAPSDFQASASQFVLPRPPRGPFKLKIETRLDPAANTKLMGLYRSGSAYCTQCEAEGFRRIAYFLDRPDVLSTYRVRLEADRAEAPVLLANGNLENFGEANDPSRHWAIWVDPHKKPCYLFALVAGDLGAYFRFIRYGVRTKGRARDLCGAGARGACALRHGRSKALDGLGRARLRTRIRSRRV